MIYKCAECHKKDIDSILKQDGPGWFTCPQCHRDVEAPNKAVPGAVVSEYHGLLGANGKIKSHSLARTEALGADGWVKDSPEFPEFGEP